MLCQTVLEQISKPVPESIPETTGYESRSEVAAAKPKAVNGQFQSYLDQMTPKDRRARKRAQTREAMRRKRGSKLAKPLYAPQSFDLVLP